MYSDKKKPASKLALFALVLAFIPGCFLEELFNQIETRNEDELRDNASGELGVVSIATESIFEILDLAFEALGDGDDDGDRSEKSRRDGKQKLFSMEDGDGGDFPDGPVIETCDNGGTLTITVEGTQLEDGYFRIRSLAEAEDCEWYGFDFEEGDEELAEMFPFVEEVTPTHAPPGGTIEVRGVNFGTPVTDGSEGRHFSIEIFQETPDGGHDYLEYIVGLDINSNVSHWQDNVIRFQVPTDLAGDPFPEGVYFLSVVADGYDSQLVPFEVAVSNPVGVPQDHNFGFDDVMDDDFDSGFVDYTDGFLDVTIEGRGFDRDTPEIRFFELQAEFVNEASEHDRVLERFELRDFRVEEGGDDGAGSIRMFINGGIHVESDYSESSIDYNNVELSVQLGRRGPEELAIDGEVEIYAGEFNGPSCIDDFYTISTIAPIQGFDREGCPSGGVVKINDFEYEFLNGQSVSISSGGKSVEVSCDEAVGELMYCLGDDEADPQHRGDDNHDGGPNGPDNGPDGGPNSGPDGGPRGNEF